MSRRVPGALLAALGVGATVVVVSLLSATTTEPDSSFSGRGGATSLVEEALAQGLETLRLLSGPRAFSASPDHDSQHTLLVLVAPERPYRADEVDAVHAFLEQGGSVLVADNFGHGNSVTAPLGITFERVRLVEASAAAMPATLGGRTLNLQTSAPTALLVGPGAVHRVLASSSSNSFLDRDGDGLVHASEPPGPFPVVVESDVGEQGGLLMVLADPTLLASDSADNAVFRVAILERLLPDGGRIVVDESRSPSRDPWLFAAAALVDATTSDPWRYVLVAAAAGLLLMGFLLATDAWGPHRFNIDRFVRRSELGRSAANGSSARSVQWTRRGRAALAAGLALALAGLALGNQQATYAASFLLLGGALAMWRAPPRVRAVRQVGAHRIHEEGETKVELSLDVAGRRSAEAEILDSLPQEFQLTGGHNWFQTLLRPGRPATFTHSVRGVLRGPYPVGPLRVRSTDPFGLRVLEQTADVAQDVLVLPRLEPLTRIPFKSRIPMLTLGPHLVKRAGDGTEFHALRDYQAGDSIRSVNWKASARHKGLVVNQRVHESMATVTVFLDARAVSGAGTLRLNPLNEGCRAAFSVIAGALLARDKVQVFVYGDGVRKLGQGGQRIEAQAIGADLARLEPRGTTTLLEAVEAVLPDLKPKNPFVLVSGLEADSTVVDGMRLVRQREALAFVYALNLSTEPGVGAPEPEARRVLQERERAIAGIQATGTQVLSAVPGMPFGTLLQVGLR